MATRYDNCARRVRCQFIKAQDLFDEMYASLADRSTRQLLKRLARLDVLRLTS